MSQTYRFDELLSLCAALVDGALEESQAARIRALLHADSQAREFYLRFMEVHALLALDYSGGSTPVAMPGGSSMPRSSLTVPALGIDVLGTTGIASESASRRGQTPFAAPVLALAFGGAMAAMLLVIGLAYLFVHQDRPADPPRLPQAAAAQGDHQSGSKPAVARLIELDKARWDSGDGPTPKVGDLIKPGPLRLQSGAATIAFRDGVVLSVEGPNDLDVEPEGRVRIKAVESAAEGARLDNGEDLDHARQTAPNASGPVPHLDLDPAYPALVRDSRPIGYWRFTVLENGRFSNEIPGAPPLVAIGAARAEGDPRGNRYLCQIVVGRRMPDPTDLNDSRAFRGCLDELVLYDHPLPEVEIRHHFHAGGAAKAGRRTGLQ